MMELARVGPFADAAVPIEAAREQAALHRDVAGRLEMREYACLVAARSAENLESVALARVAPKIRRDILAMDAEEDKAVRRFAGEHDGDDGEHGGLDCFDDDPEQRANTDGCPEKPVDVLKPEDWTKAWQFHRVRKAAFIKDMQECGVLREIYQANQLPHRAPHWADAERAAIRAKRIAFHSAYTTLP